MRTRVIVAYRVEEGFFSGFSFPVQGKKSDLRAVFKNQEGNIVNLSLSEYQPFFRNQSFCLLYTQPLFQNPGFDDYAGVGKLKGSFVLQR